MHRYRLNTHVSAVLSAYLACIECVFGAYLARIWRVFHMSWNTRCIGTYLAVLRCITCCIHVSIHIVHHHLGIHGVFVCILMYLACIVGVLVCSLEYIRIHDEYIPNTLNT